MERTMSESYRGEPDVTIEITIVPSLISTMDADITVTIRIASNNVPSVIIRKSIPEKLDTKIKIIFDQRNPIDAIVFKSCIPAQFYSPVLYEIERKESATRLILYEIDKPDVSIYFTKPIDYEDQLYIDITTLSTVICFSTEPDQSNITNDTLLLWFFFESEPRTNTVLFDGYVLSRNQFHQRITACKQHHGKFCVLDIDNTIGKTSDSCVYYEKHAFRTDFEFDGHMALTNEYFRYSFMIRDGLYEAIRLLQEQGITIYVMTWGDIIYGRTIIKHLNRLNWKNKTEARHETDTKIYISPSFVFSRRNTRKKALPKHFVYAIPFYTNEWRMKCMAIDDDPGAWDVEVRNRVYHILPFSTISNDTSHLLTAVQQIIQSAYE